MAIIERDVYRLEGSNARGFEIGGKFAVLKGAKVHGVKKSLENAKASGYLIQRTKLEQKGKINKGVLVCDCLFTTPTQAGDVILGTTGGGPEKWINEDTRVSLREDRKMQNGLKTKISKARKVIMAAVGMGAMFLFAGCGSHVDGEQYDKDYAGDKGNLPFLNYAKNAQIVGTINFTPELNVMDALYEDCYSKSYDVSDSIFCERDPAVYIRCSDFAFAKRRAALNLARRVYCYSFKHYVTLDGVSGFIYNVSYLAQIPHKLLRGLRCMDGPVRYVKSVVCLGLGAVCAVVGCVASPVVNTICHPFETLSNLTVGAVPLGLEDSVSIGQYIFRTNIIASLWDLVWGGIVYPLWQALTFWW